MTSLQDKPHITRLNTLLNVAAVHPRSLKRQLDPDCDWHAIAKKVRAKQKEPERLVPLALAPAAAGDPVPEVEDDGVDSYKHHFGVETPLLSPLALTTLESRNWQIEKTSFPILGKAKRHRLKDVPEESKLDAKVGALKFVGDPQKNPWSQINPKLSQKLESYASALNSQLPTELLQILSTYQDVFFSTVQVDDHDAIRAATSTHVMSHITKTRNRILKNNETLSHADGDAPDDVETRDQGFTRPKVLILVPLRNSALKWFNLLSYLSLATSVENRQRFESEFGLPEGAIDRLAQPDAASKYPPDHVATFAGNIDDSFRVGLKITRKTLKCFSEFYQSDIIIASPLGLRMSIEKERDSDFLSSLELVIVDQADVLGMQNWEHVQFVFDRINKIPSDAHGADFSRIKPWYLDGKAANLRQTLVFSSYDTPDINALFNRACSNVAGKLHIKNEIRPAIKAVKRGVQQKFIKLEVSKPTDEDDVRFEHFKTKTFPGLLKSAVASSGHTLIFVPSYFDFLRVEAHLKTIDDLEYACISEYSSNSDIARARNAFLAGKLPFLILTERFYFFKRYRIRGARTIVFYSLPEHAAFYQEIMTLPFEQVVGNKYDLPDETEVTAQVIFSPFDTLKLERVVGVHNAKSLLKGDELSYTFA